MESDAGIQNSSNESVRLYAYLAITALLSLSNWILLLLPNFLEEKRWSSQEIGWAIGIFYLFNLVFQILSGQFAERYGNVPTALAGAGVAFAGGLFYMAALWLPALIFPARVFHAAGSGMIFSGALMQLVRSVPLHLRGRMMGYYGLPGFVMMGIGPVMAEFFAYRWGFKVIFGSIPVLAALIAWVLNQLQRPIAPHGIRRPPYFEALRASLPGLRTILILSVFFGLCFAAWNSFIAPAVRGAGPGAVSSFGLGYAIGAVMTRLGISTRLDAGSRRLWAILTLVAYAIALGLIPHAVTRWEFVSLGLICGMVHGIYYPCLSSIASERFHPLHTAQAMSLYVSASSLGMFIGPPLWGAIADRTGYPWMFASAAVLLGTSSVLFVLSQRRSSIIRQQTVSSRRHAASERGI